MKFSSLSSRSIPTPLLLLMMQSGKEVKQGNLSQETRKYVHHLLGLTAGRPRYFPYSGPEVCFCHGRPNWQWRNKLCLTCRRTQLPPFTSPAALPGVDTDLSPELGSPAVPQCLCTEPSFSPLKILNPRQQKLIDTL